MARTSPTEPPSSERRETLRVLVDLEVDYKLEDNYIFAYVTDLSATGIFVRTPQPEPPGTRLKLRFKSDAGAPIEVEGEVIWVKPHDAAGAAAEPGMGIRFLDLDFETRDRVRALVRRFTFVDTD